jgi:hypothetical protein
MLCTDRTISSEIILDTPNGTPRRHGSCGISFRSVWRQCFSVQDWCMVCAKRNIGSEIIMYAPNDTPRWPGSVEVWCHPFRDSANLYTRSMHSLHRTYHRLKNHFGRTQWNSKITWVMWNFVLVHLETVLVSVQGRCTVCAKRTIGSEIVLETVLVSAQDRCMVCAKRSIGSSGCSFIPFGDRASLDAR